MACYQCALCGHHFELPTDQPELPPHVYPSGLRRRQRCTSRYGVRV
jgi:hypothetical protein